MNMNVKNELLKQLFELIQRETGITKDQLCSDNKTRTIARARRICCYVLRERGFSYSFIGRLIHKHHTTALLAVRQIKKSVDELEVAQRFFDDIQPSESVIAKEVTNPLYENIRQINVRKSQRWHWLFDKFVARCQVCCMEDIVEVHHIIPLKNGGSDHPSNVLILCPNHHTMLHAGMLLIKSVPSKLEINEYKSNNLPGN